jgi:hypothetical protein
MLVTTEVLVASRCINTGHKTGLRFAPAYGAHDSLHAKVKCFYMELERVIPPHESLPDTTKYKLYRYVRASISQTGSVKRTLQCHAIISVRNPIGETICEISKGNICELGSLPNASEARLGT